MNNLDNISYNEEELNGGKIAKLLDYDCRHRKDLYFEVDSDNKIKLNSYIIGLQQKSHNCEQALIDIREYIHSEEFFMLMNSGSIIDCPPNKPNGEDYFKAQGKLDRIIDKILGDEKDE